jgi:tRNA G18 (ribose-2'-O)-methylase SpoU
VITTVTDVGDPRLDAFRWRDRQLASRLDRLDNVGAGLFIAEGDLVVDRALSTGHQPVALLCEETAGQLLSARVDASVDIFVGSDDLRSEVTGLGVPLRATGLFRRPPLRDPLELLARSTRIVVAEAIDNPTNLGAITRSAAALGWDAMLLCAGSADPLARRALRVSMGSGLVMPFARLSPQQNLTQLLSDAGFVSYALTPDATARDIAEIQHHSSEHVALLMGSERDGLDEATLTSATQMVRIPMHSEIDSLNVGAAAAIALHMLGPNTHR